MKKQGTLGSGGNLTATSSQSEHDDFDSPIPSSSAQSDSSLRMLVSQPGVAAAQAGSDGSDGSACTGVFEVSVPYKERDTIIKNQRPPDLPDALGKTEWSLFPFYTQEVKCDGKNKVWKVRIFDIRGGQTQWVGASNNVLDDMKIDAAEFSKECKTLRKMQKDLADTIASASAPANALQLWLPDDFVQAHEDVHRKLASDSAKKHYGEAVTTLEAITRPCKDFKDSGAAGEDMKNQIEKARTDFRAAIEKDFLSSSDHKPAMDFTNAHYNVLQPWLDKVNDAIARANCP